MPLPEQKQFFLDTPLYGALKFEDSDLESIFKLLFTEKQIDSYCIHCKKHSVFHAKANYLETLGPPGRVNHVYKNFSDFKQMFGGSGYLQSKLFTIKFECTRNKDHSLLFVVTIDDSCLIKIGQYPSLADISNAELVKYKKLLSPEKYKELNRGIGLVTHGVGIGAFVYLRRVFEALIFESYFKSKVKETLPEESFSKLRIEERIENLKAYLPDFLVRNKIMYGILSKGIHELSEEECLNIFAALKLGIELILDEELEKQIKAKKIEEAEKAINKIQDTLSR